MLAAAMLAADPLHAAEAAEPVRSDLLVPAVSLFLPGFGQWTEGQYAAASIYTGVAVGGYLYAGAAEASLPKDHRTGDDDSKDFSVRRIQLGELVAQGAGGLSAYHAFRTAVRSRQTRGEYRFLRYDETPLEVLVAPFDFTQLAHVTTWAPLAVGGVLAYLTLHGKTPSDLETSRYTREDAFFTGAYSYNAGTHEEAVFRGWLMPLVMDSWGNPVVANAAQATLFAAAHLATNPRPLPQLLLGLHLGYVTEQRDWRIAEAVFIHTWWDVIAFTTAYHYRKQQPEAVRSRLPPAVLWLPPLQTAF